MAKKPNKDLMVGIDIGTSKVVTIVCETSKEGGLNIIGVGSHPSEGLKKGVVVNIEATVQSIQNSVKQAEDMAGCQIYSAYTGIAGSHIRSINSHGIVAIRDTEVTQLDIDRVIDAAKAVAIPADQKILHILPQEFIIDNQDSIREPIGMSGVRLEAKVHIVTGAVNAAQNIVKCLKRCGLVASDIVLEQFASSQSILTEDEKELGVCMIDIGGGTTDIAIFTDGSIRHTAVIPIAGDQVTSDMAIALRTSTRHAEEIKLKYSCALQDIADVNLMIDIPAMGDRNSGRHISQRALAEIIEARYEELFSLVSAEIRRSGLEDALAAGIVITGGGSKAPGAAELGERVFKMPVRVGGPQFVTGLADVIHNPIYATGVGLLLYGMQQRDNQDTISAQPGMKSVWGRMKNWFQGSF